MATQRLPRQKYCRQLRAMAEDLWWWEASYRQAAENTPREWLQGRFQDRAAIIEDLRHQLASCIEAFETMPRLA